jgi:tRNA pseudouridine38-40 synthase
MADYQSILAYDGTEFAGFQRQRKRRTVQGTVEGALRQLGWEERSLRAAGRTDTGVHAVGQVVAFGLDWKRGPQQLTSALNALLPPDVAVRATQIAPPGFHPRYAARHRRYRYRLVVAEARAPLEERFAWRVWPGPDLTAMRRASASLLGTHDFGAFGRAPRRDGHSVRTVAVAEWAEDDDGDTFRIEADAFLFRMVRRIVGALVDVGQGRRSGESVAQHLATPTLAWQGTLAPARGLCLEAVIFEDE